MKSGVTAGAWAEQQVAAVRDDPAGRLALMQRCYNGPFGKAPRHLPYRRAATSFMRWQLQRGVLQPPFSDRPGSPWWRAVNERILRDGCEAVGLSGDLPGPTSSRTVDSWMSFADYPTARAWYRAHNGSVVAAYLAHRDLAEAENAAERFFMNVVLCRVLYTHTLVAAPRISLGWLRPLAPLLGDPRLGMTGSSCSCLACFPTSTRSATASSSISVTNSDSAALWISGSYSRDCSRSTSGQLTSSELRACSDVSTMEH